MNYGRSILVSKKHVATLKLNALLVDMEHLFLWQTKAVLAWMTILKPHIIIIDVAVSVVKHIAMV